MEDVAADAATAHAPSLYVIFLNSTHHEYSWPRDFVPAFTPFLTGVPLLSVKLNADETELLKNRYRNALAFTDGLVANLRERIEKTQRGNKSIFVFTGDHGEELLEEGNLSHSSKLNSYQIQVPLYFSFAGEKRSIPTPFPAGHIDIFPTLLDYLGEYDMASELLPGRSLLRPHVQPTSLTANCSNYTPHLYHIQTAQTQWEVELRGAAKAGRVIRASGLDVYRLRTPNPSREELFLASEQLRKDVGQFAGQAGTVVARSRR